MPARFHLSFHLCIWKQVKEMANVYVRQKTISGSMTAEEQHAVKLGDWSCGRWREETLLRCSSSSGLNTLPLSTAFACSVAALSSPSALHSLPQLAFQATQGSHHSDCAASKTSKMIVSPCASGPSRKTTVFLPLWNSTAVAAASRLVLERGNSRAAWATACSRELSSHCAAAIKKRSTATVWRVIPHSTSTSRTKGLVELWVCSFFSSSRGFLSDNCNARGLTARCQHFALWDRQIMCSPVFHRRLLNSAPRATVCVSHHLFQDHDFKLHGFD